MSKTKFEKINLGPAIRERRKLEGYTLAELSAKTSLSVAFLSQVERGKATPSLMSLFQISEVLGIDMNKIIKTSAEHKIYRTAAKPEILPIKSEIIYERLSNQFSDQKLDAVIMEFPSGYESTAQRGEGRVGEGFLYILEGQVEISYLGETFTLAPGDSMHYDLVRTLNLSNLGSKNARILWVGSVVLLHSSS